MKVEMIAVAISILMFFALLALLEVGYQAGKRWREQGEAGRTGVGVVEAAVFTLLGLLLGFQFAGAASRLETRRQIVVQEANNIGTAFLRLDLLGRDDQPALRDLFRRYTDARIEAYPDGASPMQFRDKLAEAMELQRQIWKQATEAAGKTSDSRATMLLIPALNEMIDITTTREVSRWTHAPTLVLVLLGVLALLSALLAGHAMAAAPVRHVMHSIIFATVTSIAIYVVLDMEFPRIGLIRIGAADQAMLDVRKSMD